jgi:hypothetical protein
MNKVKVGVHTDVPFIQLNQVDARHFTPKHRTMLKEPAPQPPSPNNWNLWSEK